MKILITGGNGLIGGRLSEYLCLNHNVTVSSRSEYKTVNNIKIVHNSELLNELSYGYDAVIHAAGPNSSQCNDQLICDEYIDYSTNLINACITNNIQKFIFTSSTRIYGKSPIGTINEQTNLVEDDNYSKVKIEIEHRLRSMCASEQIQSYVLRISNGYGYPIHNETNCWDLLLMYACKEAIINKKISLRSNGREYKDFIPVSFIVRTIEKCLIQSNSNNHLIYNIVSGKPITVKKIVKYLVDKIETRTGQKINFSTSPEQNKFHKFNIDTQYRDSVSKDEINRELDCLIDYCLKNFRSLN
ncbi:MAG: SDR family oxidoreductase [Gammaproteobacteria bacterium]|nr:SDR family oxidoreductase [Gammaproteobacteria bacterium]MBT4462039.1 SDR family oxidoreductase [Gammaproteobacteria bacterium]MBT4654551.1 SDR family oxidoreductase [Gammaproteobacteria bacterium]MBT5117163.1 SDR family oxidoreductase [Gammaproteobacteria bacterium]MBT5761492.1 SDR family oxidoreductase [Gammaproteobacteria bacterium]